jgi:hypothetical protein
MKVKGCQKVGNRKAGTDVAGLGGIDHADHMGSNQASLLFQVE